MSKKSSLVFKIVILSFISNYCLSATLTESASNSTSVEVKACLALVGPSREVCLNKLLNNEKLKSSMNIKDGDIPFTCDYGSIAKANIQLTTTTKSAFDAITEVPTGSDEMYVSQFFNVARDSLSNSFQDWSMDAAFRAICHTEVNKYYLSNTCKALEDDTVPSKSFEFYRTQFIKDVESAPYCLAKLKLAKDSAHTSSDFNYSKMVIKVKAGSITEYSKEIDQFNQAYKAYTALVNYNFDLDRDIPAISLLFEGDITTAKAAAINYIDLVNDRYKEYVSRNAYEEETYDIKFQKIRAAVEILREGELKNILPKYRIKIGKLLNSFDLYIYIENKDYMRVTDRISSSIHEDYKRNFDSYVKPLVSAASSIDSTGAENIITNYTSPSNLWKIKQRKDTYSISGMVGVRHYWNDDNDNDKGYEAYGPIKFQFSWPSEWGYKAINIGVFDLGNALIEHESIEETNEKNGSFEDEVVVFSMGLSTSLFRSPWVTGLDISYREHDKVGSINLSLGFEFGILAIY